MKIKIYKLLELLCVLLHRDSMKYKVLRYRTSGMIIGENARIFSKITTGEPYLISIGNNVTISTNVSLITHDNSIIKCCENGTDLVGKIVIGDNCFIGSGAIILPGVTLPNNTIVGAGSIVVKSIETSGKILAGNPAGIIGDIESFNLKYKSNIFNFRGLSYQEKKMEILKNSGKLIIK